jgi:CDP-diglyceride synthetase
MNLPPHFSGWMYLFFAFFGSASLVLVILVFWNWMKVNRLVKGTIQSALKWNAGGYVWLFVANWFACGIGAGPGNLLSTDPAMHNAFLASMAAVSGMFASVVGWICLLVGQRKLLRAQIQINQN